MTNEGWDGVTVDGTNSDLVDSIASAVALLHGTLIDPIAVTDVDLASVADELQNGLPLASEMFLIWSLRAQMLYVDQTTGPFSARLSQLPDRLLKDWEALRKRLEEEFGLGGPELVAGVIEQNFATHGDEDDEVDEYV
jgi:hypothetical protein